MLFKPNLNIGFYFIRNGSWTCTENTFGHVKLNLKLSLFQNLDLDYSISSIGDHFNDFSISLFCKIPKSKIITKKKIWSKSGMLQTATLLNVQYGKFEVLSNSKTLYVQWRLLGQSKDNFQQRHKTKPTGKNQIVSTPKISLTRRNLKLHQLVSVCPTYSSIYSLKQIVLRDCMVYAFFIGALGFVFWAKIKSSLTSWDSLSGCPSTRVLKIRYHSLGSYLFLKK